MKKSIAILLLITIIINSIAFVGVFSFFQNRIKKEMKYAIKHSLSDEEVVNLTIPLDDIGFKRLEKHEFLYNNEMYDIIDLKIENNLMKIRCINDKKEMQLFKDLNDLIAKNFNTEGTSGSRIYKLLNSFSLFLVFSSQNANLIAYGDAAFPDYYPLKAKSHFPQIDSPPPRFI